MIANDIINVCQHKPISTLVEVTTCLRKYLSNNIPYKDAVYAVKVQYHADDVVRCVYTDSNTFDEFDFHPTKTLLLLDEEYNENAVVRNFLSTTIKVCEQCFVEYVQRCDILITR